MDVRIDIERAWKKADYTIGRFLVNGMRFCESLEDTDRGMKSTWTEAAIKDTKIPGRTAIPSGTYKMRLSISPKFRNKSWAAKYGGLVPELVDVKGYSGVRIHPSNYASELEGCIAIGDNKVKGGVINSVKRYTELMDNFLYPAWKAGAEITINIS